MIRVDNLTDQADQIVNVVLGDGTILTLELYFNPATERWTVDVSHETLTVAGVNICNFPNLLRAWRNVVAFGLACATTTGQDPTNVEDFVNGNATLFVLDAADVQGVEVNVFGGVLQ